MSSVSTELPKNRILAGLPQEERSILLPSAEQNNGNHYGQLQNGNNGNHYGQSLQTTQTTNSVPGPDTLMLLGGGRPGL